MAGSAVNDWVDVPSADPGDWVEVPPQQAAGPTRHNDSAGPPKPGTPHADEGPPTEGVMGALFTPVRGAVQVGQGVKTLATEPGLKAKARGASDVLRGAMGVATPYLGEALLTAPVATTAALAAGVGAQKAVEKGGEALGVPPEYTALASDVAALGAGGLAAKGVSRIGRPSEVPAPEEASSVEATHPRDWVEVPPEAPKAAAKPTAETPTVPETPETIDAQMQQLQAGTRKAVMVPAGTKMPSGIPDTLKTIRVPRVGNFVFDPAEISPREIRRAAKFNRLPEILGAKEGGMGAPDKTELEPPVSAVVGKTPEGVTTQGTVTDEAHLPEALEQTAKVTPPEGTLAVVPPEQEVAARQEQAPQGPAPVAQGSHAKVYTPNQTQADVQYALMDIDQLKTSFDEGYAQELQPRQTDRLGSRQRIEELKQTLNPEQMGESVNAGDGAPITLPDGQVVTRNHGTQAMKEMYASGSPKIDEYRQWLAQNAQRFGIDPAAVESTAKPVLTRVMTNPPPMADLSRFAEEANFSTTARMSDAEQATMLAKRITGKAMEAFDPAEDGTPNPEFVRALLEDMPSQERAAFQDSTGRLSQSGIRTIRNAIFAKAYPDTSAIERMAEDTDSNIRNISNGMLAAAPDFVRLNNAVESGVRFDRSIAAEASRAAETISGLKDQRMTVDQWLQQENIFGRDDLVDKLVQIFTENRRSPKRITQVLKEYTNAVDLIGDPRQGGMFGPVEPPTRLEILEAANEAVKRRIAADKEAGKAGELFPADQGAPADSGAFGENAPGAGIFGSEKGSGLADPLGIAPFVKQDILPTVEKISNGSREAIDSLVAVIAPRKGVPPRALDEVYKLKGGREAAQFVLHKQLEKWSGEIGKLNDAGRIDFIDRQKTGRAQATPELQQLSDFLRKADDSVYAELQKYNPSLPYLENHYRVLWEVIPGAKGQGGGGLFSRRPLQGSKGMLKKHTLDTISEGIAMGGKPVSTDPIRMFEVGYADAQKYITAQKLWERYGDMGLRKFAKSPKDAPDGFVPLDDRIARVYFKTPEGVVAEAGRWYVEENTARILNNFLSRDLIRENPVGRALLGVKNATTAVELSLSPFHAVFEANEAIGSSIGIGLRRIVNLGFRQGKIDQLAKGVGEILAAPLQALPWVRAGQIGTSRLGALARRGFEDPAEFFKTPDGKALLKQYPDAHQLVEDAFTGGLKLHMPEDYRLRAVNSFREAASQALREGNMPGFAIRAVPAANELIMSPLFEHYIPNLKLGFFLREYSLARAEYGDRLASGEMSSAELARKVADGIENRFGEMNFDNLFWNRTFKTALQLMLRSVTWKFGNVRAYGSAMTGQTRELVRGVKEGKLPMLDPNMGWLMGMTLWTAVLGATIHTAATGEHPKELKDLVYPVVDKVSGIRVSLPTYWRDIVHAFHAPGGYLKSGLSGEIGRVADVWSNRDFYGNKVYSEDDPAYKKAEDVMSHLIPLPFSVQSGRQATQEGGSKIAQRAGYAGFTKAPSWLEHTPMQAKMREYQSENQSVGGRTSEQAARGQLRSRIIQGIRRGENMNPTIAQAIQHGLLSAKEAHALPKLAREDQDVRGFNSMDINRAAVLYSLANDDEKKRLRAAMIHKVRLNRDKPGLWNDQTRKLVSSFGMPVPQVAQQ